MCDPRSMALEGPQEKFLQLLREMKTENERNKFLKWIHINWNLSDLADDADPSEKILKAISEEIRSKVPLNGILPTEKINMPVCGPNSDCNSQSTVHIDEFLYNDEDVDDLVEEGQLSRYYCHDCHSRNIKILTFISHSMSIERIKYVFKYLLPPLEDKTILDVGSRFGGVLYGAYLYTHSPKIIGVEINPDLCKIQTDIVQRYNFSDRIQIICNSIINEIEMLSSADVIVLNNIFEFFADTEQTISSWHLLVQNIKVGCILVTIPHLNQTFEHIEFRLSDMEATSVCQARQSPTWKLWWPHEAKLTFSEELNSPHRFSTKSVDFDWKDWVEAVEPFQANNFDCDDESLQSHREMVKHYRVKKKINLFKK